MYATFFRSFYLVFAGLFVLLLTGAAAAAVNAARLGQPLTTITGVALAVVCGVLVQRAIAFRRE